MTALAENADPNLSFSSGAGLSPIKPADDGAVAVVGAGGGGRPPLRAGKKKKGLRVSISPKATGGGRGASRGRRNRRRSGSHFGRGGLSLADADDDDDEEEEEEEERDDDEEESDIEFTLDDAPAVTGATKGGSAADREDDADVGEEEEEAFTPTKKSKSKHPSKAGRRRRRSSARFLRLSNSPKRDLLHSDLDDGADADAAAASSEHLGEIYRQAIRMNAENKINAGNSWGLRLIENMDKFITEEAGGGGANGGDDLTPRAGGGDDGEAGAREELRAARRMKGRDGRGRVNFAKASCTLDASVKIYSYRVDDVHLSSYRVLANLNRTDNSGGKKGGGADDGGDGEGEEGKAKRRTGPRGPTETLESNPANINMSKLDSAYDIDPLFHKMSKSFDEGGAKGLLLGNLGVSQNGCRVVFDSNEEGTREEISGMDRIDEEGETATNEEGEDGEEKEEEDGGDEEVKEDAGLAWKESEVDIAALSSKLSTALASTGYASTSSVPFVPQLESLRSAYAALEGEGYAVDERAAAADGGREGRKRLRLYDAPDEEEREAERSIHVIAMERSRGSVLGMSFDTNFRLSMGGGGLGDMGLDDDEDGGGDFGAEDFGGEGEFAPPEDFGGEGEFAPDFGGGGSGGEFDAESRPGSYADARSHNAKALLDALCSGDAFYDNASGGGNGDYAFFDMKKFERATDGNLWAGSQHWKKRPEPAKKDKKGGERRRVMFDDDGGEGEDGEGKRERKRAAKKDRVFVDFGEAPDIDAIFEKKKKAAKGRPKKSCKDPHQMPSTERDFLLPPDAGVDISQLSKLFSRPNAVVRRRAGNNDEDRPIGKTVGFHDVGENPLGFDDGDDGEFGGDGDAGFAFDYGGDEDLGGDAPGGDDADEDYNTENFDKVRKVEKIEVGYATVAKKVDVRRLKRDLWAELEEKTAVAPAEEFAEEGEEKTAEEDAEEEDAFNSEKKTTDVKPEVADPGVVSFRETVERMEATQGQSDVTVSFYFICCLHLANEKGLRLDSEGLEDFVISLDDGSAPEFGTFGDGFSQTANKLTVANSRTKRDTKKKVASYVEEEEDDEEEGREEGVAVEEE